MDDVRAVFARLLRAQLVSVVPRPGSRRRPLAEPGSLGRPDGSARRIARHARRSRLLAIPVVLLGFDGFFERLHGVFFAGDSWRFPTSDTLIRHLPRPLLGGRLADRGRADRCSRPRCSPRSRGCGCDASAGRGWSVIDTPSSGGAWAAPDRPPGRRATSPREHPPRVPRGGRARLRPHRVRRPRPASRPARARALGPPRRGQPRARARDGA